MFRIVKMVWAYLWMLETCMEWHILLPFEKLVPEPQYGGFGGNSRVKLLCVCIYSMYGPNEVKLHTTSNPMRKMCEASLASLCSFSDYGLCWWLQGNKRLCNRGTLAEGRRTSPLLNVCAVKRLRLVSYWFGLNKGFFLFARVRVAGPLKGRYCTERRWQKCGMNSEFSYLNYRSNLLRDRHKHFNWSS